MGGSRTGPACISLPPDAGIAHSFSGADDATPGSGFYFASYPTADVPLARWVFATTGTLAVLLTPTGTLKIQTPDGPTESILTVPLAQWIFIDVAGHNAAGTSTAAVTVSAGSGPVAYVSVSGFTAGDSATGIQFGGPPLPSIGSPSDITMLLDDLYINNSSGSENNSAMGGDDFAVLYIAPIADSAPLEFTPAPGGPNYANLIDIPPDASDSFNAGVVGLRDVFQMAQGHSGTTPVVQFVPMAAKDESSGGSISGLAVIGGIEYLTSLTPALGGYQYVLDRFELNPATSLPFTGEEVDAAFWGYQNTGTPGGGNLLVTQFGIEVVLPGSAPAPVALNYIWSS